MQEKNTDKMLRKYTKRDGWKEGKEGCVENARTKDSDARNWKKEGKGRLKKIYKGKKERKTHSKEDVKGNPKKCKREWYNEEGKAEEMWEQEGEKLHRTNFYYKRKLREKNDRMKKEREKGGMLVKNKV